MADLRFGIAFQTERLALIREIARNLVGEARPAGTSPTGAGSLGTGQAGGVAAPNELDAIGADDALLADRVAPRPGQAGTEATRLAGLRLPQPMFLEPQAYLQVLAKLATSDPVLAAMTGGSASPEANPANPDAQATLGASAALAAETPDGAPGAPVNPAGADPAADSAHESARSSVLRRELASGNTAAATAASGATEARSRTLDGASAPIASAIATPAETSAVDARAATESVVEHALASLGLAEGAATSAAMRTELGGIIASFILNAHFQPGWPPLRPVQDVEAKAFVAQLAKDPKLSKDDIAMLTYLANFGLNRTQLARILKLVAAATNRSKLLQAIAQVFANIGTVLGAVQAEIEALAAELKEARAGQLRRERLPLR